MMFMTAKVDIKKLLYLLVGIAAIILGIILFAGGKGEDADPPNAATNDQRVAFLGSYGWEAANVPAQSGQVRIPEEAGEVFTRYNTLQKSQGYDLSAYAGKNVMRYVYEIDNYPGATAPVYATLLVYEDRVIGGDVTDTSANGQIRGFQMPEPG